VKGKLFNVEQRAVATTTSPTKINTRYLIFLKNETVAQNACEATYSSNLVFALSTVCILRGVDVADNCLKATV
jgi:hypothetical protein